MITETYVGKGTNNFNDFAFSSNEWPAPTMVSPAEIKEYIKKFNLAGRRAKKYE